MPTDSLYRCYLINRLGKFRQIYKFGAFGTKMKWLDFEVKRSNVEVTTRSNMVKRHTHGRLIVEFSIDCV